MWAKRVNSHWRAESNVLTHWKGRISNSEEQTAIAAHIKQIALYTRGFVSIADVYTMSSWASEFILSEVIHSLQKLSNYISKIYINSPFIIHCDFCYAYNKLYLRRK